jgi:geranylgeranyl pyrophosphate synthase
VLTQIGDDFHGVWGPSRRLSPSQGSDLAAGRKTLPVLYALAVAPTGLREHLWELLDRATDNAGAEAQARQVITDLGALYYLLVEAELRRQRGSAALQPIGPPSPALRGLLVLLDRASPWGDPSSYPSPGKGYDYPRTLRGTILTDSTG